MAKAVIVFKLTAEYANVMGVFSETSNLANPIYSNRVASANLAAKVTVTGLKPNTLYYYAPILNGVLQTNGRNSFRTFPVGAASFKVVFSSCSYEDSNNICYTRMKDENAALFLHMGDLHYLDIGTNDPALFDNGYNRCLAQPNQYALWSSVPNTYTWDDHDYGENNGGFLHAAKGAAQTSYRRRYPHYPLPDGKGQIYHTFVVGRVRFIVTDLLSERRYPGATEGTTKYMLDADQLAWFKAQLLQPEPVKVWVNSKPWIGAATAGEDYWAGYTTQRTEIATFIKSNNLTGKVMILSGDMHGLAIDDGTNSSYATGGGGNIPVFQAAPIDSSASSKGGPWSKGSDLGGSDQYGVMNITDNGGTTIGVEWLAKDAGVVKLSHTFTVPV